ncbi:MAG: UvrD-helicase domain-containing protein [Eubacteriales bacterium]|nr:UvrD-helicase domain-containing protein [Eubacteriales bacterium]
MPKFTPQQQSAIDARGSDLLVSAAAGSGKTTVLVARVLALLEEGMDIDRLLIVTFTRAAASDMRAKLQARLEQLAGENERFREQLDKLPMAAIGTLHSHCASLMREHFEAAGVDPAFRIMEPAEADKLASLALREAMDEVYAQGGEGLERLVCGRDTRAVAELASALYRFARNRPDPWLWLEDALARTDGEELAARCCALLEEDARALLSEAEALYAHAHALCLLPAGPLHYAGAIEADLEQLQNASALSGGGLRAALQGFAQARPGRGKCDETLLEEVKKARKRAGERVGKAVSALCDPASAREDMRLNAPALQTLVQIVRAMHERLEAEKDARAAYDYADLEQRAIRVMQQSEAARAISGRYDAVFVDEYQDISDLQEAIIRLTARPGRLFLVGDVKQSIYRFRLAEPGLFIAKQRAFEAEQGGRLIRLNRNFRSRSRILGFTNRVFAHVFRLEGSEIGYSPDEALYPGATWPDEDPPVEVALLSAAEEKSEEDESPADAVREGLFIARRIAALVGTPLHDPSTGEIRPVRYRDIVILARTRERLLAVRDVLDAEGVPCFADTGGGYAQSMEIRHVLALLALVDNGRRDNDLLAALLSPCFGFSPEDIALVRIACPKESFRDALEKRAQEADALGLRLQDFLFSLAQWRMLSRSLPLDEFLDRFLRETGFAAYVGALAGGKRRLANLDLLCDMAARHMQTGSGSLASFLDSFKMPGGGAADYGEAQPLGEGDDVVRLMTVHKSKGLEFPIVIGAQLERDFTRNAARGEFAAHRDLGFAIELHDPALRTRRETVLSKAVHSVENLETINEELRLLYVLMTRASDRLILVGRVKDLEGESVRWRVGGDNIRRIHSWLDAVAPCVPGLGVDGAQGGETELRLETPSGVPGAAGAAEAPSPAESLDRLLAQGQGGSSPVLDESYRWVYPHVEETLSPLKLTVTSMARQVLGPAERQPPEEKPAFLGGASRRSLERGTATHAALCALDLPALRHFGGDVLHAAVRQQLDLLAFRGVLSREERASVRTEMLVRFLESDVGQRACAAQQLRREWAFNLRMRAQEALGPGAPDTEVLVQGVIDCCFIENGRWILLDYKTDRADDEEELLARYGPQLRLYRRALEQITGIPVAQSLLCLLRTGRALEVQ